MYKHGEKVVNSENSRPCTVIGSQTSRAKDKKGVLYEETEYCVRYEDGSTDWISAENTKKFLID
jgi:hypothetical protein